MFNKNLSKLLLAASCLLVFSSGVQAGPISYQTAVAEYKAGKYQSALSMFRALNASSPKNALVHYYMALCQYGLGHVEQAKQEYQIVIDSGDVRLKPLAEAGLGKMSKIRTSGTPASSGTATGSPS